MTIRLGIIGSTGRMGRSLLENAQGDPRVSVICERNRSSVDPWDVFLNHCDVVVDVSSPQGTRDLLSQGSSNFCPLVIGTTGLDEKTLSQLKEMGDLRPVLYAPNFSLSVAWMTVWVEEAASVLTSTDVDIVEAHHRHKKDAPSGTALSLAQAVERGRGRKLQHLTHLDGKRWDDSLCLISRRSGAIPGSHSVYFTGDHEEIVMSHTAFSRDALAKGALEAIAWIFGKGPGVYGMRDVIGIGRS